MKKNKRGETPLHVAAIKVRELNIVAGYPVWLVHKLPSQGRTHVQYLKTTVL